MQNDSSIVQTNVNSRLCFTLPTRINIPNRKKNDTSNRHASTLLISASNLNGYSNSTVKAN